MAVVLPHTGIVQPQVGDAFSTSDIANNWGKVDAAPGMTICTSVSRPGWSSNQTGMWIFETDTGLTWWWDGAVFRRTGSKGYLGKVSTNGGTAAVVTPPARTTVLSLSYTVPAGGRAVRLDVYADASTAWTELFPQQLNPVGAPFGNVLAGMAWYLQATGLPTIGAGANTLAIAALQTTPTSFSVVFAPGAFAGGGASATAVLSIAFPANNAAVNYSYCSLTATEI